MKYRWIGTALAAAAITAVILTGCGGKTNNAGNAGNTADNTTTAGGDVQALYKKNCVSCHGDQLEGRLGPNSNLTKVGGKMSREQIVTQIANGGSGMPGFKGKLSEAEIGALADWLAAKK